MICQAMYDPTEAELIRRRIEILERNGQDAIADELREKLAKLEASGIETVADDSGDEELGETEVQTNTATAIAEQESESREVASRFTPLTVFPPNVAAALNRHGVVAVEDLDEWDVGRLLRIPGIGTSDVEQMAVTLARLGLADVLGSAPQIPDDLPPVDPGAIDRLDGRTPEDIDGFLRKLAAGVPDREVSAEMGAPRSWYGFAHQRGQSLKNRHYTRYAQFVYERFQAEFKHAGWWDSVELERCEFERPRASKTNPDRFAWRLRLVIRVSEVEAIKHLPGAVRCEQGWIWRSVWLALIEKVSGESEVQLQEAKVTRIEGAKHPYRVTDGRGQIIKLKNGRPLDRGGYNRAADAQEQAAAINQTLAQRRERPLTRKQKRAGRSAQIAAERAKRGGAVHPPKKGEQ